MSIPRMLCALLLLLCVALPTQAQEFAPPPMNDPLILRLLCTGTQEWTDAGPGYSRATVFSVPEPDGQGERLYVGYVRDKRDANSRHAFWRGPVATYWEGLGPVPEHISLLNVPNPTRYRLDRLTRLPDGRLDKAVMEIDLDAQPPQLRLVGGGPGQLKYRKAEPLGEELSLNDALRLVARMRVEAKADNRVLALRGYDVVLGAKADIGKEVPWGKDSAQHPYLMAVCRKDDPDKSALRFLPLRINGWEFDKILSLPRPGDPNGVFVARMFSLYWGPSVDGVETLLGSWSHVRVGLRGMSVQLVSDQLHEDYDQGIWFRPEPTKKPKEKTWQKP